MASELFPVQASEVRHVARLSGGAGSWAAAKRVAAVVPREQITLLFADTIIEDQDTYRFLLEGAANIMGVPAPVELMERCLQLTELSLDAPHCEARKMELMVIRRAAVLAIPGLVWLADGRHPWEVFEDERFIGNSRTDPCSKVLKRAMLDEWRDENCTPDASRHYIGIGWREIHRLHTMLPYVAPWQYEAPLCDKDAWNLNVQEWIVNEGMDPPRAYDLGFPHNNCGGFCCKGGQASFALLYRRYPHRYAWHEFWENRLRDIVGDYSMMTDRRGDGLKKPLTMTALRERMESGETFGSEEWGGCGCAISYEPAA